jgi:hypothetical protein
MTSSTSSSPLQDDREDGIGLGNIDDCHRQGLQWNVRETLSTLS